MNFISQPWPWYVAGPLIALTMFILLFVGKQFGMSSNLRTACAIGGAGKMSDFFQFNWKAQRWNLLVVLGSAIGGYLASEFLANPGIAIDEDVVKTLKNYNINSSDTSYLPDELFSWSALANPRNLFILIAGGLMVGFGARYAGGCTSGHAISGLSNLQLASLIAVIGFFIGGLIMIHLLYPIIF
ncbi:YeeE/YedE family protein [Fulvivirga sp. RKSG066]|nr:YeeE/YedE family protein [Fulvivirga aurantia]